MKERSYTLKQQEATRDHRRTNMRFEENGWEEHDEDDVVLRNDTRMTDV
jgi:hypothetical protein